MRFLRRLRALLAPRAWPVGWGVNDPRRDDRELIGPRAARVEDRALPGLFGRQQKLAPLVAQDDPGWINSDDPGPFGERLALAVAVPVDDDEPICRAVSMIDVQLEPQCGHSDAFGR